MLPYLWTSLTDISIQVAFLCSLQILLWYCPRHSLLRNFSFSIRLESLYWGGCNQLRYIFRSHQRDNLEVHLRMVQLELGIISSPELGSIDSWTSAWFFHLWDRVRSFFDCKNFSFCLTCQNKNLLHKLLWVLLTKALHFLCQFLLGWYLFGSIFYSKEMKCFHWLWKNLALVWKNYNTRIFYG